MFTFVDNQSISTVTRTYAVRDWMDIRRMFIGTIVTAVAGAAAVTGTGAAVA